MSFPQLRVRTGYTTRETFGRVEEVMARLKELGVKTAACVDNSNTWGHVRWERGAIANEIQPAFGMEVALVLHEDDKFKPRGWVLATDTRKFYNFTTKVVQAGKVLNVQELAEYGQFVGNDAEGYASSGIIRFTGGAVEFARLYPTAFDYIDVNPASLLHTANALAVARETGLPLVLTSSNDMPSVEYQSLAYAWEVRDSVGIRHIASPEEMWEGALKHVMTRFEFDEAVANAYKIEARLQGIKLPTAPLIHLDGDLRALCEEGKQSRLSRGHIAEWTDVYQERMEEELHQIQMKDFDSYFLVVSDLVRYAKTQMLVGPARGSSAGSLVCYLLDITEIDPLPHKLLFARFIDVSRADLPDIDIDFADTKRHLVFEYLQGKYGKEYVSKMGNINTLKALSVLAQVGKKFDIPIQETNGIRNAMIEYSSGDARYGHGLEDTMADTSPGRAFTQVHPEAAKCLAGLEIHPSHYGVHAAAILVCNEKISDFCTVNAEGVAQIDKPDSEYLNLLKIDALGLRTLGIIQDTGVVDAETLYGLRLDDKDALNIINDHKVSDIFQFSGRALQMVASTVDVDCFQKIDHITALARPGPLSSGMMEIYSRRASGQEPVTHKFPVMERILADTYGVILYQEQIMQLVREVGQFDWAKTSVIRKAMSGRKGEEYFNQLRNDFVEGALPQGYTEQDALEIWDALVSYGSWAFNASHSVSYAVISYWCCWLKAHFPLEWAAANLRSAKDETQTIEILREMVREGVQYTALDPMLSSMNWEVRTNSNGERVLVGGIMNAKGYGPVKALKYIQAREAGLLTEKSIAALANAEVQFTDLAEASTLWGHLYENPGLAGVFVGKIKQIADIRDGKEDVFICKLKRKILDSENDPKRIKKRGGKLWKDGPPEFLDMHVIDDSVSSVMTLRIRPNLFQEWGREIYEKAPKDSWWLVRGWKIPDIGMFIAKKMKQLTVEQYGRQITDK